MTVRWLMGAVAVVALILGLGVAYLRSRDPHGPRVRIRVFNKTSERLDNLTLQFDRAGPEFVWPTSIGAGVLSPGRMASWDIPWPGQPSFAVSWTTPDGTVKTGQASVKNEDLHPGSGDFYLDFHVTPPGVRSVVGVGTPP